MAADPRHPVMSFLDLLNAEAVDGAEAAEQLVAAGVHREALLAANPSWLRVGTMQTILEHAQEIAEDDPLQALQLTSFVVRHTDRVAPPSADAEFLVTWLVGEAWREHARALLLLTRLDEALEAATLSVELFSRRPEDVAERASSRVLLALILHARGDTERGTSILDEALGVLGERHDAVDYLAALRVAARIELDRGEPHHALQLDLRALALAETIEDEREQLRILRHLTACTLRLGQLDLAAEYRERVRARLLERGMFAEAEELARAGS
jgi:tetratricopeptide (TPR) repeat protein